MTYFYELRHFNSKGECFSVREYDSAEVAQSKFDIFVENTVGARGRLIENGMDKYLNILASQIQLVKRDDNYTVLIEINNWVAA